MTVQTPIFLQGGSHSAEEVRRFIAGVVGDAEGVSESTHLAVTESGTPAMSVDVAEGSCWIKGTEGTYQGVYFVDAQGSETLTISAADATNDRIDLIVMQVEDSDYSGSVDAASLAVVEGTPAASPSAPTLPDNALPLAEVLVQASVSSITDADITDSRVVLPLTINAGTINLLNTPVAIESESGGVTLGGLGDAGLSLGNINWSPQYALDVRVDRTVAPYTESGDSSDARLHFNYPSPETLVPAYDANAACLMIHNADTGDAGLLIRQGTYDWGVFSDATTNHLVFSAESVDPAVLEIDGSGFVGVNTDHSDWPGSNARLMVYSSNTTQGVSVYQATSSITAASWTGYSDVTTSETLHSVIRADGDMENTNNSYGSLSDERLKRIVGPARDYTDDFLLLEFVKYVFTHAAKPVWNEDRTEVLEMEIVPADQESHEQLGLIAQQVEKVFPGLVKRDEHGICTLRYSVLNLITARVVQTQELRMRDLESRLADLEAAA